MRIALASPRVASSLDDGLNRISRFQLEAKAGGAEIVCFPEIATCVRHRGQRDGGSAGG